MVKDKKVAQHVLEILNTCLEKSIDVLHNLFTKDNTTAFLKLTEIQSLYDILFKLASSKDDDVYRRLLDYLTDGNVSLRRIKRHLENLRSDIARQKIEFELIAILRATYGTFYYKALIYPCQKRMDDFVNSGKMHELFKNYYYEESLRQNKWKYDVSITITGFNKLSYTKLCVESLFRHLPKNFTYEIIFNNHGSTDGTKEYFESMHPDKQIDLAVNSNLSIVQLITEGRYRISISNDVILTPNALDIMYEALISDEKIAWAVPATSSVSNLQEPKDLKYSSIAELDQVASTINKRNLRLEEQRTRLCNPITAYNNKIFYGFYGFPLLTYIILNANLIAFPDDMTALLVRRFGYKSILLKDVYCHHFGSVTIGKIPTNSDIYLKGREKFKARFGVDPWDSTICYDGSLFDKLPCLEQHPLRILGVNGGFGANILKIKEKLKENGNFKVTIDNISTEREFDADLKPISAIFLAMPLFAALARLTHQYDYILLDRGSCSGFTQEELKKVIRLLLQRLTKTGVFIIHKSNNIENIVGKEMQEGGNFRIFRSYAI